MFTGQARVQTCSPSLDLRFRDHTQRPRIILDGHSTVRSTRVLLCNAIFPVPHVLLCRGIDTASPLYIAVFLVVALQLYLVSTFSH